MERFEATAVYAGLEGDVLIDGYDGPFLNAPVHKYGDVFF
jgi:hypothetical protein